MEIEVVCVTATLRSIVSLVPVAIGVPDVAEACEICAAAGGTINGARAAHWADRIGSIEPGKDADLVMFDTNRPEWQPLINPVANLVYSATGDSVRDVFVAGEHVVAAGQMTKIDESKLYDEIPVAVMRFSKHLKVDQMVQLRWPVS